MTLAISIPGRGELRLDYLMLDVNGTLTNRGALIEGIEERLHRLRDALDIGLVSADTFGTLDAVAERLGVRAVRARTGKHKLSILDELGRDRCAVIGNGANDASVLDAAALGFAILGPEGTSALALGAADVLCASANEALDLLLDPRALTATLRA